MLTTRATTLKQELGNALSKELEIARRISSGERSNHVREGRKTRKKGHAFVYEFEELLGFPPEEGAQISFSVAERVSKGRFLGEINSKFIFELEEDLGSKIESGVIVSDPLFLLEKQISILGTDSPFENQVALSSIGLAEYSTVEKLVPKKTFMEGLNSQQRDALEVVSANSVTYIWGPPGTGKTTTMGSIVAALADLGQRVLLVSNTNLAVDTALERCLDRFQKINVVEEGMMLRLGTVVKPELINKYSQFIDLEDIFERQVIPLRAEIDRTSALLRDNRNKIQDLADDIRKVKDHQRVVSNVNSAKERLREEIQSLADTQKDLPELEILIKNLESELHLSDAKSGLGRLFSKIRNPGAIRTDINTMKTKKEQIDKKIVRISSEIPSYEREIEEVEAQAKFSIDWLAKHPEVKEFEGKLEKFRLETSTLERAIEVLQEEIGAKHASIIRNANVIACTGYRPLLDKEIAAVKFDVVVVDEASMIPLPLYYCAASLAKSRIVVAGDFRQLPPIVRVGSSRNSPASSGVDQEQEMKLLMTANPFTKSGVIARSKSGQEVPELVALRDQYRMRTPISNLISDTFYPEHTLRTIENRLDKKTPWGNESFIVFDTASLEPESSTVNGKSRRNFIHALVVKAISEELFDDGWELSSTAEKSFGIITPYAKQSSFIEKMLSSDPSTHIKGGVSTVHRFQGNERDLMIIDLTKVASAREPALGNFLGNPDPLSPDNAMWNVAISRARQHVIVVAHMPTLDQNKSAVISQLVTNMKSDLKVVEAKSVIDQELLAASQRRPSSSKGSISWYTGESFYRAFQKDLSNAQTKLLLASPFTTQEATNKWMPYFTDLIARDVEIVALTKPLSEKSNSPSSAAVHTSLHSAFKELREVSQMHEKLAVIDEKIVWLGSLNILSHNAATEIMVRIESPDFAQSIIEEYQNQRIGRGRSAKVYPPGKAPKIGDRCDRPGCNGTFILKYRKVDNKPFLSCNQFNRGNGCRNATDYIP